METSKKYGNQQKHIEALVEKLKYYQERYYQGDPVVSDEVFDRLEDELRLLAPDHAYFDSVGYSESSLSKHLMKTHYQSEFLHNPPMLSLDKTYDVEDIKKWSDEYGELVGLYKIDGMSASLIYRGGELILGKSRGNGLMGEDITEKLRLMPQVPSSIKEQERVEVRGEVFLDEESFKNILKAFEERGLEIPSSPRNLVAGIMLRKQHLDLAKYLHFMAFDVIQAKAFTYEEEKFAYLKEMGFLSPPYQICKSHQDIDEFVQKTRDFMQHGNFQIDGAVFVLREIAWHEKLGSTGHHPRFKKAFKFLSEVSSSEILGIEWQVSRNGVLTPVAKIHPVELSGALIHRVTLHNLEIVENFSLKVGDKIEITRSGEVIPKFLRVLTSSNKEVLIPQNCPECASILKREEKKLICPNELCSGRLIARVEYFAKSVGIEWLSEKRIRLLYQEGLIKDIDDLYRLEKSDLEKLPSFKEKLSQNIYESIQASKKVKLEDFLVALGIKGVSSQKLKALFRSGFQTLQSLLAIKVEDLEKVEGFGRKTAEDFINSLSKSKDLIERLQSLGIEVENRETIDVRRRDQNLLNGLHFCITGELSLPRETWQNKLEALGATLQTSVNKKTNYLITNDKSTTSTKLKKAKELGTFIITEKELQHIIAKKRGF